MPLYLRFVVLAVLAAACWGPRGASPRYLPPWTANEATEPAQRKDLVRVAGSIFFLTWEEWNDSGWSRPADPPNRVPAYVFYDDLRRACVVPDDIWALNPPYIACPTGWIPWRGR